MEGWDTPTPWPDPVSTPQIDINPQDFMVTIADSGVGMWQTANRDGLLDLVLVLFVLFIVLIAIRSIQHKIQSL
jgi:hypothetical protein